jgi:hypothetical protein
MNIEERTRKLWREVEEPLARYLAHALLYYGDPPQEALEMLLDDIAQRGADRLLEVAKEVGCRAVTIGEAMGAVDGPEGPTIIDYLEEMDDGGDTT